MSQAYEEIFEGETLLRSAPGLRHERICNGLHQRITGVLVKNAVSRILSLRTIVQLSPGTMVRPDLAVVTVATGKLWLAVEVIDSEDHHPDTVLKKGVYEEFNLTRLWMVDPRYDNVELYHGTSYGLALRGILAGSERLKEPLQPEFDFRIAELFAV